MPHHVEFSPRSHLFQALGSTLPSTLTARTSPFRRTRSSPLPHVSCTHTSSHMHTHSAFLVIAPVRSLTNSTFAVHPPRSCPRGSPAQGRLRWSPSRLPKRVGHPRPAALHPLSAPPFPPPPAWTLARPYPRPAPPPAWAQPPAWAGPEDVSSLPPPGSQRRQEASARGGRQLVANGPAGVARPALPGATRSSCFPNGYAVKAGGHGAQAAPGSETLRPPGPAGRQETAGAHATPIAFPVGPRDQARTCSGLSAPQAGSSSCRAQGCFPPGSDAGRAGGGGGPRKQRRRGGPGLGAAASL